MELLLSFIIPCFNSSKTIESCIDSIVAISKYGNISYEILCLVDKSKDNTLAILHHMERENKDIHVVDLIENKGVGGARNVGLHRAKGKYIWFVDSDDRIVSDFCSQLVRTNLLFDVLCFNYRDIYPNRVREIPVFSDVLCPIDGMAFIKQTFKNDLSNNIGFVWRFIYRRQYLLNNNLQFPENVNWEDTLYMPKSLILAKNVISSSMIGYEYCHNDYSVCCTFGKSYPGNLLYELTFCAGSDLLQLSTEIEDGDISSQLRDCAITEYFNHFPLYLFRQKHRERRVFYSVIRKNKKKIEEIKEYLDLIPKLLLYPVIGPIVATLFSLTYKTVKVVQRHIGKNR